mgnify:CR=1 FL=1
MLQLINKNIAIDIVKSGLDKTRNAIKERVDDAFAAFKSIDEELYEELLIPSVMLRHEGDLFLDNMSIDELSEKLNVKITPVSCDGYEFADMVLGIY